MLARHTRRVLLRGAVVARRHRRVGARDAAVEKIGRPLVRLVPLGRTLLALGGDREAQRARALKRLPLRRGRRLLVLVRRRRLLGAVVGGGRGGEQHARQRPAAAVERCRLVVGPRALVAPLLGSVVRLVAVALGAQQRDSGLAALVALDSTTNGAVSSKRALARSADGSRELSIAAAASSSAAASATSALARLRIWSVRSRGLPRDFGDDASAAATYATAASCSRRAAWPRWRVWSIVATALSRSSRVAVATSACCVSPRCVAASHRFWFS